MKLSMIDDEIIKPSPRSCFVTQLTLYITCVCKDVVHLTLEYMKLKKKLSRLIRFALLILLRYSIVSLSVAPVGVEASGWNSLVLFIGEGDDDMFIIPEDKSS